MLQIAGLFSLPLRYRLYFFIERDVAVVTLLRDAASRELFKYGAALFLRVSAFGVAALAEAVRKFAECERKSGQLAEIEACEIEKRKSGGVGDEAPAAVERLEQLDVARRMPSALRLAAHVPGLEIEIREKPFHECRFPRRGSSRERRDHDRIL